MNLNICVIFLFFSRGHFQKIFIQGVYQKQHSTLTYSHCLVESQYLFHLFFKIIKISKCYTKMVDGFMGTINEKDEKKRMPLMCWLVC